MAIIVTDQTFAFIEPHQGTVFYSVLQQAHDLLRPKTYLEIGTATGASLALARCPSIAVDPGFHLNTEVVGSKPACLLFQTGSDAFFDTQDPRRLLGGPIDIAFLDGMHLFEFLIRDFYNTEKSCSRNSVIFLHDCIPTDSHIGRRMAGDAQFAHLSPQPSWWAGDLWKAVLILKEYRSDLKIVALDAPPTGLVAITNLDPTSTLLQDNYFGMIETYRERCLTQETLSSYVDSINLVSTDLFESFERLSSYFWV